MESGDHHAEREREDEFPWGSRHWFAVSAAAGRVGTTTGSESRESEGARTHRMDPTWCTMHRMFATVGDIATKAWANGKARNC